jgi:hypothetical protein
LKPLLFFRPVNKTILNLSGYLAKPTFGSFSLFSIKSDLCLQLPDPILRLREADLKAFGLSPMFAGCLFRLHGLRYATSSEWLALQTPIDRD